MQVTVRYFASIRESIGHGSETRQTSAQTVAGLRDELLAASPAHATALARGKPVRAAVNQLMASESALLSEGCDVAFFPPVTGG